MLFIILTEIKEILRLLNATSEDKVNFKDKVISFQGYSFMFRDPYLKSQDSYVTGKFSSKFSSVGFWSDIIKYSLENLNKIKNLNDLNLEDTKHDFLYGGSLKTLVPSLKFGGDEVLFDVWILVKTPEGFIFPATLYYGKTGTSLGGWYIDDAKEVFPPEFFSLINFSPFDFAPEERNAFIEALELSLKMVPVTDYYGICKGENGYTIMGVKDGKPYLKELGWVYDEVKEDRSFDTTTDLRKRYYVEGYLEEQNFAIWCADCILEQEIEVPHYPIFVQGYEDSPVCEICDKELKVKVVNYSNEPSEGD